MKLDRDTKKLLKKYSEFNNLLVNESERGSVIIAAAIFDEVLSQMLIARLVPSLEREDELLEGANAPLGTLSAKIDLAYRVGLVTDNLRASLHVVRKLRNDFAHVSAPISFSSQSVKDRTWTLLTLNRTVLELLWSDIRAELEPLFHGTVPDSPTDDVLVNFVEEAGHAFAFRFWAALVAAALATWGFEQGQLRRKGREEST